MKTRQEQENEANLFARCLLMPEAMVLEYCRSKRIADISDDRNIKQVAQAFGVPIGVAAIRLDELAPK